MSGDLAGTPFPGGVLGVGRANSSSSVLAVQQRLNALGCGPVPENGSLGVATRGAIRLFQARFRDPAGVPLIVDGVVGPITWATLFPATDAAPPEPGPVAKAVLTTAQGQVGVLEHPIGSNRGPQVDQYLQCVGIDPSTGSYPWCAAFVYWCFAQASATLKIGNPAIRTAGVLDLWNKAEQAGVPRLLVQDAVNDPLRIARGSVFVMKVTSTTGHVGIVEGVEEGRLTTIEGNTNEGGSREGIGVFRHTGPTARKINTITLGFVDYTGEVAQ